jgi:hypothetical protein
LLNTGCPARGPPAGFRGWGGCGAGGRGGPPVFSILATRGGANGPGGPARGRITHLRGCITAGAGAHYAPARVHKGRPLPRAGGGRITPLAGAHIYPPGG